jgi:hypothetical protein
MTLEGVLGPNNRLEEARGIRVEVPDALCVGADGRMFVSAGRSVLYLPKWGQPLQCYVEFERPVTAVASSKSGMLAVGTLGGGLLVCDGSGRALSGWKPPAGLTAAADALFLSENELAVVDHGYKPDEPLLSVAPWDDVGRGKLLVVRRDGEPRVLASGLNCPMGVSLDARGELIVTELERARIVDVSGKVRRAGYPGYLGRLRKAENGYVMASLQRRRRAGGSEFRALRGGDPCACRRERRRQVDPAQADRGRDAADRRPIERRRPAGPCRRRKTRAGSALRWSSRKRASCPSSRWRRT